MATAAARNSKTDSNADNNVTDINEAKPKSTKKLIIIASAAVLLLGGGGGAAWYLLKPAANEAPKPVKVESAPPVFMEMETFTVNLAGDRILQAGITLQVKEAKDSEQLKLYLPQVKNRLLLLLSSKSIEELQSPAGKETLATDIATSLRQPYAKDLAPPTISGVYLTSFVIQ